MSEVISQEQQNLIVQLLVDRELSKIKLKVSEKGCLLILGMRTLPIALYRNEFEAILRLQDEIRGFMKANGVRDRI